MWRWALTLAGLVLSVALSLAFGGLFLFLFLPFLFAPFALGGGRAKAVTVRTCPSCGVVITDRQARFCPRDGTPLAQPP